LKKLIAKGENTAEEVDSLLNLLEAPENESIVTFFNISIFD